MSAPDPSQILTDPQPLNKFTGHPFFIDEFPADTLFGVLGGLAPRGEPTGIPPANAGQPHHLEPR